MTSTPSITSPSRRGTTHLNGDSHRPSISRGETAPARAMNGHFASVGEQGTREQYEHGVQVIDSDKEFNPNLQQYLAVEKVLPAGFNYHLISVFGSQSTGKSTLLNYLFGTQFGVMNEQERRQTTKGIWMSKNKREETGGMAENILVMDVEGTDGRERGEDQDFERKSSLFALATSEVLMVNIWEHQVGLYQGANMGLLKTVFEVNLQLFGKDKTRSLLFFVIRDHTGQTPLGNLRDTVLKDLQNLWSGISKPKGLEDARIYDYFDFSFVGLPHKVFALKQFEADVEKLSKRFRAGHKDPKRAGLINEDEEGIFLPQYHRRIPADGFAHYASGIWDQIVLNKDLDLPTQQELLAQFRCDEIMREVLIPFDGVIAPLESKQAEGIRGGNPVIVSELGASMNKARSVALAAFDTSAGRYHKGVYQRKTQELSEKIDTRLKALSKGQLDAAQKSGLDKFSEAVSSEVKAGQKKGASYDFAHIVEEQKKNALTYFERIAKAILVEGAEWSSYQQELTLFKKSLDESSKRLRKDEMRRLATRVERWVRSRLGESIGLEFNKLGSGRGGSGAPEHGEKPASERDLWDRVWNVFTKTVQQAEKRFTDRAQSFDASSDEVEVGLWRLRRKSWGVLRAKVDEEMMEGNLLLKLRENFEDKFRYDAEGVPRIWRPTDDIEGAYTRARESTLQLIPLLSRFRLSETGSSPPLDAWIGNAPQGVTAADEEDLAPIGGVDDEEGRSLEEETTVLTDAKSADLATRFRRMADGVFVEAKRGALGGVTQIPIWFYGLLLALGWNELVAVLRNPLYFIFLILMAVGAYVTYTLNMWGPMYHMANAASTQGLSIAKDRLREFLLETDTGRQAMAMSGADADSIKMSRLDGSGKKTAAADADEDEEDI